MTRMLLASMIASLLLLIPVIAQKSAPSPNSRQTKISRALQAGPVNITKDAKVVDVDENGRRSEAERRR